MSGSNKEQPDLAAILKEIIRDEYKCHITDFLVGARVNEKKGLFLVSKIVKHKGEKKFTELSSLKPEIDINQMNFKAAAERYKNKSVSTCYKDEFKTNQRFLYKNIFQERDIGETSYSEPLTPIVTQYIRNWLRNETCEYYKDQVLEFLRGFYSTVKSNKVYTTVKQFEYPAYKRYENFSKKQFFEGQKNYNKNPAPLTVEEVRKILKISPCTLQNLRINGTLNYNRIGGIIYYKYDDITKMLNQ